MLKDSTFGFPKRFVEVWCASPDSDSRQQSSVSWDFLKKAHVFWAQHSDYAEKKEHHPDGYALGLFMILDEVVKQTVEENPTLRKDIVEMLQFSDTHMHRFANGLRKCMLFLESRGPEPQNLERRAYTIYESCYALHNLRRQWAYKIARMGPDVFGGDEPDDDHQPGDQEGILYKQNHYITKQ